MPPLHIEVLALYLALVPVSPSFSKSAPWSWQAYKSLPWFPFQSGMSKSTLAGLTLEPQ